MLKKKKKKYQVWLAELTHTGQTIASETIPLAPGSLAAYALPLLGQDFAFHLFKLPQHLIDAWTTGPLPQVMCFTNYIWNFNLSYELAKRIKKQSTQTVILFGGPNYPAETEEQAAFLQSHSAIDFYIAGEGEQAVVEILKQLAINDFDVEAVKQLKPANCHFWYQNKLGEGPVLPRLDIKGIPSPYLAGLLDGFFADNFMPLIQTVRGCPFSCAYCCEGQPYFNEVSFRDPKQVRKELIYIARRSRNPNLNIADSNFGQYPQDLVTARSVGYIQKKYGYPKYIHVATGKNKKHLVAEAAKIMGGAIRLSASVQSTDEEVLRNIRRSNVPLETLVELAQQFNRAGSNSYSEIILGLPGDTKEKHLISIAKMINLGLNIVRCYTLMLLKGSDLSSQQAKKKFGFVSKFRVLPRCFGFYQSGKTKIPAVEIEEVAVASRTLSFKDYLDCRLFDLTVEIFYNDAIFCELVGFLRQFFISPNDLLQAIHRRLNHFPTGLKKIYRDFRVETTSELWDSEEALSWFAKQPANLKKYLAGQYGSNLIFKYKSFAYVRAISLLHDVAFTVAQQLIIERKGGSQNTFDFLKELKIFSLLQKKNILDAHREYCHKFYFDMEKATKLDFFVNPADIKLATPQLVDFKKNTTQQHIINNQLKQFGRTVISISRILSRVYIKKMYRQPIFYRAE